MRAIPSPTVVNSTAAIAHSYLFASLEFAKELLVPTWTSLHAEIHLVNQLRI